MNRVLCVIGLTFCVAALVAVVSPVCADTVLFQENFEEDTAGNPGTSLTAYAGSGWTGSDKPYLSNLTVIDTGHCAEWKQKTAGWCTVGHAFSDTPIAGDTYTLTATLYAPNVAGSNASIWLADSNTESYQVGFSIGRLYFDCYSYFPGTGSPKKITGTATNSEVDVKIALTQASAAFSYRAHGAETWTSAGSLTTGFPLSTYKSVVMDVNAGNVGAIDSILLTSTPLPEPTALTLLVIGLIGLLAYAWRKRK